MKAVLVGNQNSGKSLLFNVLTGARQKVGNFPGVTVDVKSGFIKGTEAALTDLPGVYSLFPYSAEEKLTRKETLSPDVDLILNVVDATSIERSLYLTFELLDAGKDVILVLNMEDALEKKGLTLDTKKLEELLGLTVIPVSALKKTGIKELVFAIEEGAYKKNVPHPVYEESIESRIAKEEGLTRFEAIEKISGEDLSFAEDEAKDRYDHIEKIRDATLKKKEKKSLSAALDRIALHKIWGLPLFLFVMALVFLLSVGIVGGLTVSLMDAFFSGAEGEIPIELFGLEIGAIPSDFKGIGPLLGEALQSAGASSWAVSLVQDGIVAGVGAVLNFVPQLLILFLLLALLDASGYLARVSFLFDRLFRKVGMSGKSLVSFIVGAGCSVPAILSSRAIEGKKEHDRTAMLVPFIPCNAKLPIIACFVGAFLGGYGALAALGIYVLSILILFLTAYILNRFSKDKAKSAPYLLELPEYRAPSASYVLRDALGKTLSFIERAGTVILLSSLVVWFLASFSYNFTYIDAPSGVYEDGTLAAYSIQDSFLSYLGRGVSWLFYPMVGIGQSYDVLWGLSVSAIQGLVAKEQVVSSMEVIAAVSGAESIFESPLFSFLNPLTGFSYLFFVLYSAPCFGALGALKKELGGTKGMLKAAVIETGSAYIIATILGIIGGLVGLAG